MAEHISSHFNQELENVRSEVMRMGGLVEARLQQVLAALDEGSSSGLTEVIDGDADINKLEVEIDDACQTIIARRQPAAGDLRFVLAVSRVIVDLERIGDEVKKIALKAHELLGNNRVAAPELYNTHRMGTVTLGMIHRALDAFARLDTGAVIELSETDKHLDADYRAQLRSLITFMMEDPRSISATIDIMFMNKSIERIGDHAENIAEHVVYLTRGIDVRHRPLEQIKADLSE
ncbi:phosphate signaling complex protein PhoU [Uruburuella suis]|jgi:phosphate transport system protein|uniref:Phosphate-specific transport system accessory protein PhoU n=1 Tax=Uruburuella suis TaxID=252130 RepID=A0AAE9GWA5_9NEIS|nr:phosphate signaling complex protein PhoU [Uruburuella suis]TCP06011.1 phosphate transport system protein [Uruburuella suis]UOO79013.1 phosphate signaling complex protein PhoU [Uruburuella suis]